MAVADPVFFYLRVFSQVLYVMFNLLLSFFYNIDFFHSLGRVKRKNLKKVSEKKEKLEGEEEEDT